MLGDQTNINCCNVHGCCSINIKDLPDGSGSLDSNDIFIFMDNPNTSSELIKKISFDQVAGSIWNSDLPAIINANISIQTDIKTNLDSYILPSGELAYATDEGTLRIGNGMDIGGSRVVGETYFISDSVFNALNSRSSSISYSSSDLDRIVKLTITNPSNKISYFKGKCKAIFGHAIPGTSPSLISPVAYIYSSGINYQPFKHNLSEFSLFEQNIIPVNSISSINLGLPPIVDVSAYSTTIAPTNSGDSFYYETDTFYFSASGLCTVGLAWGSVEGICNRYYGSLEITRIK